MSKMSKKNQFLVKSLEVSVYGLNTADCERSTSLL